MREWELEWERERERGLEMRMEASRAAGGHLRSAMVPVDGLEVGRNAAAPLGDPLAAAQRRHELGARGYLRERMLESLTARLQGPDGSGDQAAAGVEPGLLDHGPPSTLAQVRGSLRPDSFSVGLDAAREAQSSEEEEGNTRPRKIRRLADVPRPHPPPSVPRLAEAEDTVAASRSSLGQTAGVGVTMGGMRPGGGGTGPPSTWAGVAGGRGRTLMSEAEYIAVTQNHFRSAGSSAPSEDYIRQHYRREARMPASDLRPPPPAPEAAPPEAAPAAVPRLTEDIIDLAMDTSDSDVE